MKIINFYGAPGSGKSTLAAELFVYMKKLKLNVELATEYAKDLVYEERHLTLADQVYLLGKANHKLQMFKKANLDFVISDSPLLLSILFKRHNYQMNYLDDKIFDDFVFGLNNTYERQNFFIIRDKSIDYQPIGRVENEETSNGYVKEIKNILDNCNERYSVITNNNNLNIEHIYSLIER